MQLRAVASLLVAALSSVDVHAISSAHNETRALQSSATCVAPEFHYDFPGGDIASVPGATYNECCTPCYQLRNCAAYTWTNYNGGTCWLKGERAATVYKGADSDTVSVELVRCTHAVTKDMDIFGDDGGSAHGVRPESCCHLCANLRGCKGFAWNDYNGGTCWFKGGDVQMVYKEGVYGYIA